MTLGFILGTVFGGFAVGTYLRIKKRRRAWMHAQQEGAP